MKKFITIEIDTKKLRHLGSIELATLYANADMEFRETGSDEDKQLVTDIGAHIIARWMDRKFLLNSEMHKKYYPEQYPHLKKSEFTAKG